MNGKVLTVGLALFVAACSSEHADLPTAARPRDALAASRTAPSTCPDPVAVELKMAGFFQPGHILVALAAFDLEIITFKRGNVSQAQSIAAQLYAYTQQQYDAGHVKGAGTPAGAQTVADLGHAYFCTVGVNVNFSSTLSDNVVAIVPAGKDSIVRTGTTNAAVHLFAAQQLPQTVVVITRLSDSARTAACPQFNGPLCTPFAQFPPFYDYQLVPAPNLPANAPLFTVEECVDTTKVHVPLAQLFIAHNVTGANGTTAQLLPKASETLGLACDNSGTSMRTTNPGVITRFASAISDFFVNTAFAATGAGTGITGKTRSFSPFGIVDSADFVPYRNGQWSYHAPTFTAPPAPATGDIPGFEQPSFALDGTWVPNTSAFGDAPFGSPDEGFACALNDLPYLNLAWTPFTSPQSTGNLDQDASTIFLLRNTFFVPSNWTQDLVVGVAIDNDVQVFVNGTAVTPVGQYAVHEGCAAQDAQGFVFPVPRALLVLGGQNVLAIRGRDRGGNSYIDARLSPASQ